MRRYFILSFLLFIASPVYAQEAKVIASIKPLHSLVAAVMQGSGDSPLLLVDGASSLHTFNLRPSQARALEQADIVFYIADRFEIFLGGAFRNLPKSAERAPMVQIPGLILYPLSMADSDGDDGPNDMHIWLSPRNAQLMAAEIAHRLSERYPQHRALYKKNAAALSEKLDRLDRKLFLRMQTLGGKPFFVFHDAYQYFVRAYGLEMPGAIMLHPEHIVGAKHLDDLREKMKAAGSACVFREPSFDARVVAGLTEGLPIKTGVLDPEAASLQPGAELYFQLMEGIAVSLENCLK